jgi:hypothetical protein
LGFNASKKSKSARINASKKPPKFATINIISAFLNNHEKLKSTENFVKYWLKPLIVQGDAFRDYQQEHVYSLDYRSDRFFENFLFFENLKKI